MSLAQKIAAAAVQDGLFAGDLLGLAELGFLGGSRQCRSGSSYRDIKR